jgi:hypothetical protein
MEQLFTKSPPPSEAIVTQSLTKPTMAVTNTLLSLLVTPLSHTQLRPLRVNNKKVVFLKKNLKPQAESKFLRTLSITATLHNLLMYTIRFILLTNHLT